MGRAKGGIGQVSSISKRGGDSEALNLSPIAGTMADPELGMRVSYQDMANPLKAGAVTAIVPSKWGSEYEVTYDDGTLTTSDLRQLGWQLAGPAPAPAAPAKAPASPAAPAPVETQRRLRRHALLTKPILRALPPLYSQEGKGLDAGVCVKFFNGGRGAFYATEFDGTDMMFGYTVSDLSAEYDCFEYASFSGMERAQNWRFGTPIPAYERDRGYPAGTVRDALVRDGVHLPGE